ncbi:alpha-amylase family glycosyl hydrolase [Deinococcus yavapaiensis]|uniref:Alpha-amylase n=1 Tax=Deinococcus yavapaiensis KR-236 TaxID=694435 RepID=A0A318SDC3_9DEIO|nr:alpha-amylase family glycosyl hydrolase [Deinococcus yavapaiensis]PYE54901.1 glycosidase [Deinococcus yavapaiensis KR-236]
MRLAFLLAGLLAGSALAQSSAPSWKGQIIYQVMPDRFYAAGTPLTTQNVDKSDLKSWHGGNLKGLTEKLPYIRDFGATAVWLTPIYKQVSGRDQGATGYHGYWPENFRDVDPHFGTLADFDTFVKAAKGAGMKVLLDQVVNHYGFGAFATLERPKWFNNPSTCAQKGNNDVYCPIFALPDLDQDNREVRDFLFANADFWRARGVDGFRYDAIKHVPQSFLKDLLARDRAANTYTLGEWYDADASTIDSLQRLGFSSAFDFSMSSAMRSAIMSGSSLSAVRAVLERQGEISRPDEVALFLDNHDVARFANSSPFEDVARERTKFGWRALMSLRGIPVIWQGTEIAMRGGGDPDNRRDMRFPNQWTPEEKAVFDVAKTAVAVRKANPALNVGDLKLQNVPSSIEDDLLVFVREAQGQRVVVAWNNARQRKTYSLRNTLTAQLPVTRDLYGQDAKLSFKNGFLHLSLPAQTAAVFKLN